MQEMQEKKKDNESGFPIRMSTLLPSSAAILTWAVGPWHGVKWAQEASAVAWAAC